MSEDKGRPSRAKYLRLGERVANGASPGDTANDNAPAFTVTRGELASMVGQAVREAVREALGQDAPALLDREALALALGCSAGFVDKLRRQGMPHLRLGDSPRFELARCLAWLRKDGAA